MTIVNQGYLETGGFRAYAILAQSVGGGGGDGGKSTSVALAVNSSKGALVSIGGSGAKGGSGSTVDVDISGDIFTHGFHSVGILAQSVGGGGGAGGDSTTVGVDLSVMTGPEDLIPKPSFDLTLSMGGGGGEGGSGGIVTVHNDNTAPTTITTRGEFATGILAQSVGGRGGARGNGSSLQCGLRANPLHWTSRSSAGTRVSGT